MLLFCDFNESDGLGISVAPSGYQVVRVFLVLQQSWEGGKLVGLQWEKEFTTLLQENTFPSEVTHQVNILQKRLRGPHLSSRSTSSSC